MKSVRPPPPTSPPCKSPARSFRSPTHYPVQPSEYSCPQSTSELYESSHSYVYNERTTEGILVKKTPFFMLFWGYYVIEFGLQHQQQFAKRCVFSQVYARVPQRWLACASCQPPRRTPSTHEALAALAPLAPLATPALLAPLKFFLPHV